jgi:AhpD family alkylhydroperoxidase
MDHIDQIRQELREPAIELRALIPAVWHGYAEMSAASMAPGELSSAVKELVAVAVAVTRECDGCIAAHARGAAREGVTRQQVAEALGVTIMMNGGPGTVWAPRALRAFDEAVAARSANG